MPKIRPMHEIPAVAALMLLAVFIGCKPQKGEETNSPPVPEPGQTAVDTPAETDTVAPAETVSPTEESTSPEPAATESVPTETPSETTETAAPAETVKAKPADMSEIETVLVEEVPLGLPPLPVPVDNPMTEEKIALGRQLYFDTRLSVDGTISCATCHDPTLGWAEKSATSTGIKEQIGPRNAPTVINSAYVMSQFWDGREPTLEAQALGPIENPIEMGHDLSVLVVALNEDPAMKAEFQKVFGTDVTKEGIGKAIAAFERTVLSGNSPYDKYKAGDETAMTEAQVRGMNLFMEVGCASCHTPPLFTNHQFINCGIGSDAEEPDKGRMDATGNPRDFGKFRVPGLRDVADTGPYFHDGKTETLEEAVKVMSTGGVDNPRLSPLMKSIAAKELSDADQADIVEFLKALSGEYPIIAPPEKAEE